MAQKTADGGQEAEREKVGTSVRKQERRGRGGRREERGEEEGEVGRGRRGWTETRGEMYTSEACLQQSAFPNRSHLLIA